jgi:hypothetical protein
MKSKVVRRARRRGATAFGARAALALAVLFAPASAAHAQMYSYELRLEGGAWYPTGPLADDLKTAGTVGAAASWTFSPGWSALVSASWTPSQDKDPGGSMHVNIYQYDVGVEWSAKTGEIYVWDLSPFLGAGLGGRTYSPQRVTLPSQDVFDGYIGAGLSFAYRQSTWRIGVRDYVSGWNGIMKTKPTTGNDFAVIGGIGFRF